jgi:leucyl aminopeptidase
MSGDDLSAGGFGGLVGVGAGSVHPPRLIVLESGDPSAPLTALVGKGITFDSGGLDLKRLEDMLTMKTDLAGVASVLAAMTALDDMGSGLHIRAVLACAENMLSGTSTRPGDILRHRNGMSTEIVSPDAEGRLVLADALSYVCEGRPERVVDVATLTGSTALGRDVWAAIGTDQELVQKVVNAGSRAGDPGWQLPLWEGYDSYVRSSVADTKNAALGIKWNFGAILGALYLRQFVGSTPWAHLDISATVFRDEEDELWCQGATGTSTRALISVLREDG